MSSLEARLNEAWGKVYVNGDLVDAGSASVSAMDRGFLYGDGVFETLRVYRGTPFMLDAHLQRMHVGCSVIGLTPPPDPAIRDAVNQVLNANGLSDAYLRITVTRGATGKLWSDLSHSEPSLLVMAKPFAAPDFGDGLRLMVSNFRTDERSPLSGIKHTGILPKILARNEAVRAGFSDALLLDTRGVVSEATSANAFWVRDGKLFTPALTCGILPGVTRQMVMDLAVKRSIPVAEGEFSLDEVQTAEEMFLTSSTWEIAPVQSLDSVEYAVPGPVMHILHSSYKESVPGG